MRRRRDLRLLYCCLFLVALVRCKAVVQQPVVAPDFTAAEKASTVALAENEMLARGIPVDDRTYVTSVTLLRPGNSLHVTDHGKRLFVLHYRYKDDSVIRSDVDIESSKVLSQEQIFGYRTGVSPEEVERAKALALQDERVAALLATISHPVDAYVNSVLGWRYGDGPPRHRTLTLDFFERRETFIRYIDGLQDVVVDLRSDEVFLTGSRASLSD